MSTLCSMPIIRKLPESLLREAISAAVHLVRWDDRQEQYVPVHPPSWLVSALADRGEYPGFPQLKALATSPIMLSDGRLLLKHGYDPASGVYLADHADIPEVPEAPTQEDAMEAVRHLRQEVFGDFIFQSEEHYAAALAFMLTLITRLAHMGCVPGFMVDANVRGAGKGLLSQTLTLIALGFIPPVTTMPDKDEELRKRITAALLQGDSILYFDNVVGKFGGAVIDSLLTSTVWKDRILGVSENTTLPNLTTVIATGNNVIIGGDTARRLVHIRLNVPQERPEDRDGFRHPDILRHVRENRLVYLRDLLIILKAWECAGRPKGELKPWGSFESWGDIVRQVIVFTGLPDPAATRLNLLDVADEDAHQLGELLAVWKAATHRIALHDEAKEPHAINQKSAKGITAAEAIELARSPLFTDLRNVLLNLGRENELPTPKSLGRKLFNWRERVHGGSRLRGVNVRNTMVWSVEDIT